MAVRWGDQRWVFFFILLLHCITILLFTIGCLLTQIELPHFSHCSDVSTSPCDHQNATTCWTKPDVTSIVIIVFDALRYSLSLALFIILPCEMMFLNIVFFFLKGLILLLQVHSSKVTYLLVIQIIFSSFRIITS